MSTGCLSSDAFKSVINYAPLVSIDLIVRDIESNRILLGYRKNRPAKGFWFVPGGRVRKNERFNDAFLRLTNQELGVSYSMQESRLFGVYEHFYDDSTFGAGVSTHYVVVGKELVVHRDELYLPSDQHSDYRWIEPEKLLLCDDVHQYTKDYFAS